MHAIRFSKEKSNQRKNKEMIIQQEYKEATKLFVNNPNDSNISCLNEIKKKLELFNEEETNGIIVCAREPIGTSMEKEEGTF